MAVSFLAHRSYTYAQVYSDLGEAKETLSAAEALMGEEGLSTSPQEAAELERDLRKAEQSFQRAEKVLGGDVLLASLRHVPWLGRQLDAAHDLSQMGVDASALSATAAALMTTFPTENDAGDEGALAAAVTFLHSAEGSINEIDRRADSLAERRQQISDQGLVAPLANAVAEVDEALIRVDKLVEDYRLAQDLVPSILGYDGPRRYLVLPQNNAEIFPSGGLMSSYGVLTVDSGDVSSLEFEDFNQLFDRWQAESGGEYIEPPVPLRDHLLKDVSWGLGESGWYPDFATSAKQAQFFVELGGVPKTDGVIAIDLDFMEELLGLIGPVHVPEYEVVVDSENFSELSLELTRDEFLPGENRKVFLSYLAEQVLPAVFSLPRDRWTDLLDLLDRMAAERHLQIFTLDEETQAAAEDLGWTGEIRSLESGDFLMAVDTSVNSTKLNLVVEQEIEANIAIEADGTVDHSVELTYHNNLPDWAEGRDPEMVRELMLDGLYGDYLRLFVEPNSLLSDVLLDGVPAGAGEMTDEFGLRSFGRYFTVRPGESQSVVFVYESRPSLNVDGQDATYRLLLQKQPGTGAIPVRIVITLPEGADARSVRINGERISVDDLVITTDLTTDRVVEVDFVLPTDA